jgi:hypothetical protein
LHDRTVSLDLTWTEEAPDVLFVMTSREPNSDGIGGVAYTIADAYLWATIYYLDSATNYRECIAENITKKTLQKETPQNPFKKRHTGQ